MADTKARWFTYKRRPAGSKPVYEPQRPREPYKAPYVHPDYERSPRQLPTPLHEPQSPQEEWERFQEYLEEKRRRQAAPELPKDAGARRALTRAGERAAGRALRNALGTVVTVVNLADFVEPLLWPSTSMPPILPANYYWCSGPLMPSGVPWIGPAAFELQGYCLGTVPVWGQAPATYRPWPLYGYDQQYWSRLYETQYGPSEAILGVAKAAYSVASQPQPSPAWHIMNPAPDPNIERYRPISPDPWSPAPRPFAPGQIVTSVPEAFDNPDLPYQPDYQWLYEVGVGFAQSASDGSGSGSPSDTGGAGGSIRPPVVPIDPVRREPPGKRERHGKVMTRSAKVGIALYRALDRASESAEVVDAIYQALPKDVRDRWEKDRFPDAHWIKDKQTGKWIKVGIDRPGDNFGQYGLSGADWKLQALYWNWHKVDLVQAVKNVIKNELQDQVIGLIQRQLPRNVGNAHSLGDRELAKLLDDWFSTELGL